MTIDSHAALPADGTVDDYESWHGELPKEFHEAETIPYVDDCRFSGQHVQTSRSEEVVKQGYSCQGRGKRRLNPNLPCDEQLTCL